MGFFGKYFSGLLGKKEQAEKRGRDMWAGPALAAQDAKTTGPSGQNATAARKKADG